MTVKSIHFKSAPQRANHFFRWSGKAKPSTEFGKTARTRRGVVAMGEKTWPALIRQIIGTETTEP